MIINATSHTIRNIWKFFLVIFIVITLAFLVLKNGIRINNLTLPKVKITQLYIKLDKKFIVNIETLDINIESKSDSSLEELHNLTKRLPILYSLFEYVSIQNITYDNKTVNFLYKDEIFYVKSDFLIVDARIEDLESYLVIDIRQLILKDMQLKLQGALKANLKDNIYDFDGEFSTFNINGNIELKVENNELYYRASTKKFETLKPFMDFVSKKVNLEPIVASWIYKRIVADEYQLHYLQGKINLDTLDYYPLQMKAKATAKNAVIKFDKNAPSALVNDMDIILKDDKLIFDVRKAEYQGKDVSDTEVIIYNLMVPKLKTGIVVDINANTILDDSIHAILHAFDIRVPITQTSGTTKANVRLDIRFSPFGVYNYRGFFEISDANITLSELPIYSKSGYIKLDNGMIYLKNVNLKYGELFDIYTSGDLNLSSGIYQSTNHINSLHVEFDKLNLLQIEEINTTAMVQIKENGTTIHIDEFKTNLEFLSKNNIISVEDLSLIYPYSHLMREIDARDGDLKLETKNFKNYNIKANLKEINLPLSKDGKQLEKISLIIDMNENDIELTSTDKKIRLIKKEDLELTIRDLDIMFDSSNESNLSELGKISVEGINSNIFDINSSLKIPSKHFKLKIDGENFIFDNSYQEETMIIKQSDKKFSVISKNLTDNFINSIAGKNLFKNGLFEFYADGNNSKQFDGIFKFKNTIIKDMESYSNLMAFMHTIPSLLTLKNPGFNESGYAVTDAYIDFTREEDIINIHELVINGKSTDITGIGTINIETGQIDIDLQISLFKNLSSIVDVVPIVNYIILGDNGRLYTSIEVRGTLKKPKMKTNLLKDTASSPFGIIKRTIETPFRIFQ